MSSPFEHFLGFLYAVLSHTVTLAVGLIATLVMGIIEKHLLKRPISVKVGVAIFAAFVLFAGFQTWRDRYNRTNGLQYPLNQNPTQPQAQVNVPQAQVMATPSIPPISTEPSGFLQMGGLEIVSKTIQANAPITINVKYLFEGTEPIHDEYSSEMAVLVDHDDILDERQEQKDEEYLRRVFERRTKQQRELTVRQKPPGKKLEVGNGFLWKTVATAPLTEKQSTGIVAGQTRLYVFTWARWKDSGNRSADLETCQWLQRPLSANLADERIVWHMCNWAP